MSTPLDVLPNSTILSRISQEMPALFSVDPMPQNAISFARVHPQPIAITSISKPYNNTIVVKHEVSKYFKNFAFGDSVFLSGIPYDLTYALANGKKEINAIWDINEYSSEGVFSLSSVDLSSISIGAVFTGNIYQNTYVTSTGRATVCTLNVSSIASGRISIGQTLSGTNIVSGTKIIANGSGSGGTGTYYLNVIQTVQSTTITSLCVSGYVNIAKMKRQDFSSSVSFAGLISNSSYSVFSEESKGDPSIYVEDANFSISSPCSYFYPEYIDLSNYSIKQLVEYFQEKYDDRILNGYGGIKVEYSDDLEYGTHLPSSLLLEGGLDIDANAISWPIYTNNNFKLLIPIMLLIKDYKMQIQSAIQQTNQHIATEEWLEYWGKILNVRRQTSEINMDEMYRSRMQREALLPKSNNLAIAELVSSATGQSTTVVDGSTPFEIIFPSLDSSLKTTPFNRTSSYLPYTKTKIISPWKTTEAIVTGSITGSVLTVTAVTGSISIGQILSGPGITTGTTIVSSGGITGTYNLSASQSTNIQIGKVSSNGTLWTITHTSGDQFPVGTQVTLSSLTPTGYNGTYTVSTSPVATISTGGIATNGTLWTITHSTGYQFPAGAQIELSGLSPASYNGTWTVNTSPSSSSFTIANSSNPGAVTTAGVVTLSKGSFAIANTLSLASNTTVGRVASSNILAIGKPAAITIGSLSSATTNGITIYSGSITINGNISIMDNTSPFLFPSTSWANSTLYGTPLTGSLGNGIVTIVGTPSTSGTITTINIQSTSSMTAGTLGSLGISYSASVYNSSTSTTPYVSDSSASSTRIGPITGSGTFIVKVAADDTINNILSPNLQNFVYTLVNKYKPAGVSFTVEPLLT
ncbi:MAG: hypothetical protein EBR94_06250 [Bacteroidetes bacterium]|nr:hypothetical protein [Bacteroidota bacterium]